MNATTDFKSFGYYRHAVAVEQAESPKELLVRMKKDDPEMLTKQVRELNRAWESILHNAQGIVGFSHDRFYVLGSAAPLSNDVIRLHGALFELDEEASQKFYDSVQVQEFLEMIALPVYSVNLLDFNQKVVDLAKFILEIDAGS